VFADALHHLAQYLLNLRDTLADSRGGSCQIHADEVELQAERRQILADGVVEEAGHHRPLELLRFQSTEDRVAQFVFRRTPRRDFAPDTSRVTALARQLNGEHRNVPYRLAAPLAKQQVIAVKGALEAAAPGARPLFLQSGPA